MDISQTAQVQFQVLAYLAVAMALGAAIGFEREFAGKPAGLRTHMLVAGAAALLVALSDVVIGHVNARVAGGLVRSDPIRMIETVITGVTFLGAGTIIRLRAEHEIEGLTTAASILFAATVGVCVALSQLILAIGATGLALLTLRGMGYVRHWLWEHPWVTLRRPPDDQRESR